LLRLPEWEAVIGLEVHVHLSTRSKMFCGCPTDYQGAAPNSNVCEICLGMPGVLPVVNRRAVELGLRSALALNCEIPDFTKFDRKNYFYPDLPKGYQISQYDLPMSRSGHLQVDGRTVRITRVHLEEDTGRLTHGADQLHSASESFVDFNRSGMPLMEIVSEPDLGSASEARAYAEELRSILRYIGASDADMEKGQMRIEANVSVRPRGSDELGVKTELKNINSFRFLERAADYEIKRQIEVLESGGRVVQETRGWSEPEQRTFSQRSKEHAEDYRYFPEPDLPPLTFDRQWIDELRAGQPELPAAIRARMIAQHGLPEYHAGLLAERQEVAAYFEALVARGAGPKAAANWVVGEILPRWDDPGFQAPDVEGLAELLRLIKSGAINRDQAREAAAEAARTGTSPAEVVRERGMAQVSDESELARVIEEVVANSPQAVADFEAGKEQAIGELLRNVREATGGKANMKLASQLLRDRLSR
jgi:aspartyl-tRNA(Asn)/glutamyl-tRNA(Gln) amidotransferase subunit B